MPKGEYTRPKGSKRSLLSDPTGKANESQRRASSVEDWYGKGSKRTQEEYEDDARRRERGKGTAFNKGYISHTDPKTGHTYTTNPNQRSAEEAEPDEAERRRRAKKFFNKSNHN